MEAPLLGTISCNFGARGGLGGKIKCVDGHTRWDRQMREMECGKDEGSSFGFNSKESSTDTVVGQVFVKKAPIDRQPSHPPIHLFWWRPSISKDSVLSFLFPPRPPVLFISPSIHRYGEHIRWPHWDAAHPASCDC